MADLRGSDVREEDWVASQEGEGKVGSLRRKPGPSQVGPAWTREMKPQVLDGMGRGLGTACHWIQGLRPRSLSVSTAHQGGSCVVPWHMVEAIPESACPHTSSQPLLPESSSRKRISPAGSHGARTLLEDIGCAHQEIDFHRIYLKLLLRGGGEWLPGIELGGT